MNLLQDANRAQIAGRRRIDWLLHVLFVAATCVGVVALTALLIDILVDGLGRLQPQLFENFPSRRAEQAGMKSAIVGSLYMLCIMLPLSFIVGVGKVIKGWDQGVLGMKVGGKRTLLIPPQMGYGDKDVGNGLIPANSTLLFDIELVEVKP